MSYGHRLKTLLNYHIREFLCLSNEDVDGGGDDAGFDGDIFVMIIMLIIVSHGAPTTYQVLH
jgi:hypothetical protein